MPRSKKDRELWVQSYPKSFARGLVLCAMALHAAGPTLLAREAEPRVPAVGPVYGPDRPPEGISPQGWRSILRQIAEADLEARPTPVGDSSATWRLTSRAQSFEARFGSGGVSLAPRPGNAASWSWGLALVGMGWAGAVSLAAPVVPVAEGNRVEYRRPELTEWYVNDRRGLEQGFTILAPPPGRPGDRATSSCGSSYLAA